MICLHLGRFPFIAIQNSWLFQQFLFPHFYFKFLITLYITWYLSAYQETTCFLKGITCSTTSKLCQIWCHLSWRQNYRSHHLLSWTA
jgi:hypothetical protein